MEKKSSGAKQAQAERARRLHEEIDQLKTGTAPARPGGPRSIKQQIADRVSRTEKEKRKG